MTPPSSAPLERLRRERPDWQPWLAVVEEAIRETSDPAWEAAADATALTPRTAAPLLADATLVVAPNLVRDALHRLVRTACKHGTPRMATLEPVLHCDVDGSRLFIASLCGDDDYVMELAGDVGVDREIFREVAALVPVPFLQACNRRWRGAVHPGWVEPYCPVCGSWPAFIEVRGIERSRCFRCGRCGSEWHARLLRCTFCGLDDHDRLVSLAPENGGRRAIEACSHCLGYVKTVTTLDGCPPPGVMIEDLDSIDLDVAALDLGYRRPKGPGHRLSISGAVETAGSGYERNREPAGITAR